MVLQLFRLGAGATSSPTTVATLSWDGSDNDEDWTNGNNWDTSSSPTAGDIVRIGTTSQDISNNLAQSAVNLTELHIGPSWTGSMQTLQINVGKVVIDKEIGALALNGILDRVYVYDSQAEDSAISLDGTIRNLYVYGSRGEIKIEDSAALVTLISVPSNGRSARITIGSSVTGITTVRCHGATSLSTASSITNLTMDGSSDVTVTGSASVTNLVIDGAAVYHHNSSGSVSGSVELWKKGFMTLRDNTNSAVTITAVKSYGGKADFRTGSHALSVGGTWTYYRGVLRFDHGSTVTVS